MRRDDTRRIGSVRKITIGHSHSVGTKFSIRIRIVPLAAGCFSSTCVRVARTYASRFWSTVQVHFSLFFPYCGVC